MMAIAVLLWRLLGFPLSWRKGSRGRIVSWIGGQFTLKAGGAGVVVRIVQDLFDEAKDLVHALLATNVIPLRKLSSAVGKLSNIANLLTVWRPFLAPMYAALHGPRPAGCPPGCIWSQQIAMPLRWFRSFFALSGGFVERDFDVRCFLSVDVVVQIVLDASPWGLGGVLLINGECSEFFSSGLTELDESLFGLPRGSPDGQQVWECLAALVALRLWRQIWGRQALTLRVRGDSMTMLSLIINLRPPTPQLGLIGREIALEFAQAVFVPVVAEHIPGVANVTADKLSRWTQPGYPSTPSLLLCGAAQRDVPVRDRDFYYTLKLDSEPDMLGSMGLGGSSSAG